MWRNQSFRMFLGSVFLVLFGSACDGATAVANNDISQRIQRGESFLANLFDARLQLLPEYRGSSTYWLFHDNYLAAHLLASTRPDLSRRIRSTLETFGITKVDAIGFPNFTRLHPAPMNRISFSRICHQREANKSRVPLLERRASLKTDDALPGPRHVPFVDARLIGQKLQLRRK